jgi:hypothetical protein
MNPTTGQWFALLRVLAIPTADLGALAPQPAQVLVPLWTTIAADEDGSGHACGGGEFTIPVARLSPWDLRVEKPVSRAEAGEIWNSRRGWLRFLQGVPAHEERYPGRQAQSPAAVLAQLAEARELRDQYAAEVGALKAANAALRASPPDFVGQERHPMTPAADASLADALAARDREWATAWADGFGGPLERATPAALAARASIVRHGREQDGISIDRLETEVVALRKQPLYLQAIADELREKDDLAAVLENIRRRPALVQEAVELREVLEAWPGTTLVDAARLVVAEVQSLTKQLELHVKKDERDRSNVLDALRAEEGDNSPESVITLVRKRMAELASYQSGTAYAAAHQVLNAAGVASNFLAQRVESVIAERDSIRKQVSEMAAEMLQNVDSSRVGEAVVTLAAQADQALDEEPIAELAHHAAVMRRIRTGLESSRAVLERDPLDITPATLHEVLRIVHEALRARVTHEEVNVEHELIERLYKQDVDAALGHRSAPPAAECDPRGLSPGEAEAIKDAISDAREDSALTDEEARELKAAVDRVTGHAPAVTPVLEEVGRHLSNARLVRHRLRQFEGWRLTKEVLERLIDAVIGLRGDDEVTIEPELAAPVDVQDRNDRIHAVLNRYTGRTLDGDTRDFLFGAILDAIEGEDGDPWDAEELNERDALPLEADTDSIARVEEMAAAMIANVLLGRSR